MTRRIHKRKPREGKQLTPKQAKFVAAKVQGASNRKAGLVAGAPTPYAADKYAQRQSKNVQVAKAIEDALEHHGATPEFAIGRLKAIAEQDHELGASRLAARDILDLNGWKKGETSTVTVDIKQAFFTKARQPNNRDSNSIIDADIISSSSI